MGCDLILYYLTWDRGRKLNFKKGFEIINKMTDDEINTNDDLPPDSNKKSLQTSLQNIKDAIDDKRRDGYYCEFGHLNVLITGGESYGDLPTDLSNDIENISNISGLTEAIGFDKDNYNYKNIFIKALNVIKMNKEAKIQFQKVLGKYEYFIPAINRLFKKKIK